MFTVQEWIRKDLGSVFAEEYCIRGRLTPGREKGKECVRSQIVWRRQASEETGEKKGGERLKEGSQSNRCEGHALIYSGGTYLSVSEL